MSDEPNLYRVVYQQTFGAKYVMATSFSEAEELVREYLVKGLSYHESEVGIPDRIEFIVMGSEIIKGGGE